MNIKPAKLSFAALTALTVLTFGIVTEAPPLHAQPPGARGGQPQSAHPQQPVQPVQPARPQQPQAQSKSMLIAPTGSPIQATGSPVAPLLGPISPQQTKPAYDRYPGFGYGNVIVLPPYGAVLEPGTIPSEPAAPFFPPAPSNPLTPSGSRRGGTSIERSNDSTNIGQQAAAPEVMQLPPGATRERVIEKYGNPVTIVMNLNGETLYFSNGVVVFLRDGIVAAPEIPDNAARR